MNNTSQAWNASTKRTVVLILLVLLALVVYRFRVVIPPMVIAFLLAFILDPIVDFLVERLRFPRGLATGLIFLILVIGMLASLAAPVTVVPSIQRAIRAIEIDLTRIINEIGDFLDRPVEVWGYSLDLSGVYQELSSALRSFVASVAQGTLDIALTVASGAFWLVFILMAAFYLVKDADRIIDQLDDLAPPGYSEDVLQLRQQITSVWHAFLRGQLLLGLAMFLITTVLATAVGLPYAVAMGLLAGVTEFIPSIGPFIAAVPAIVVALIQGSSFLPMSNFWFAVLIAGVYILIQQFENNLLVPRILGRSLNLHPLLVIIAIVVGGNLVGILGMLLAAPVLATLRVVGRYVFCRLYDRDPFAEPEEEEPPKPKLVKRASDVVLVRLREVVIGRRMTRDVEASDSPGPGEG